MFAKYVLSLLCTFWITSISQSDIFNMAKIAITVAKSTITWLVISDDDVRI